MEDNLQTAYVFRLQKPPQKGGEAINSQVGQKRLLTDPRRQQPTTKTSKFLETTQNPKQPNTHKSSEQHLIHTSTLRYHKNLHKGFDRQTNSFIFQRLGRHCKRTDWRRLLEFNPKYGTKGRTSINYHKR